MGSDLYELITGACMNAFSKTIRVEILPGKGNTSLNITHNLCNIILKLYSQSSKTWNLLKHHYELSKYLLGANLTGENHM